MKKALALIILCSITVSACAPRMGEYSIAIDARDSPCTDSVYVALKSRDITTLTDREHATLIAKELACKHHRSSIQAANGVSDAVESLARLHATIFHASLAIAIGSVVIAASYMTK